MIKKFLFCLSLIITFAASVSAAEVMRIDFSQNGDNIMKMQEGSIFCSIEANGEEGEEITVFYSHMREKALKECKIKRYTLKGGEEKLSAFEITGTKNNDSISVFLFKGKTFEPLCKKVMLTSDRADAASFYLSKFDSLMTRENLFATAQLYDSASGGYYFSGSSKKYLPFEADIESTAQMVDYLKAAGLLRQMPTELKERFILFFQERQCENDGYFYDRMHGKDIRDSKRERNFTKSVDALDALGGKALYPLPTERVDASLLSAPEHYKSEDNYRQWLYNLPWDTDPYSAGNTLVSSWTTIKAYGYDKLSLQYVTSLQNTETGFWGEGLSYDTLNAAMKISGIYNKIYPYPNLDKAFDSVIYVVNNFSAPTASSIWNVLSLINTAKNTYAESEYADDLIDKNLGDITKVILNSVKIFKQKDNLYSYEPLGNSTESQGALISLGMNEGNINGNLLCTAYMWVQAYWMYFENPLYPHSDAVQEYFSILLTSKAEEKIKYEEVLADIDFGIEKDEKMIYNGGEEVLSDSDGYLKISGSAGKSGSVSYVMPTRPILSKLTLCEKIKVDSAGTWYQILNAGNNRTVFHIIISGSDDGTVTLKSRYCEIPNKTEETASFKMGEWVEVKTEYEIQGDKVKLSFFINGIKIYDTENYFGAYEGKEPEMFINGMTAGKYSYTGGCICFDDIYIKAE